MHPGLGSELGRPSCGSQALPGSGLLSGIGFGEDEK